MRGNVAAIICGLSAGILAVALVGFDVYALWINETNHTGMPVSLLKYVYGACAVAAGCMLIAVRRGSTIRRLAWVLVVIGVVGTVNVVAFEHFNIMDEYDSWGQAGLPAKP